MDIRMGSDVEFGQSIYEPFGIAQLEPLAFGGICVVSSVSGCAGFVQDVTAGKNIKNIIIADYTKLNSEGLADIKKKPTTQKNAFGNPSLLKIDRSVRDRIEASESKKVAKQIIRRLTKSKSEIKSMIQAGCSLAQKMSWDVVVKNYLLPSLQKILHKQPTKSICTKA